MTKIVYRYPGPYPFMDKDRDRMVFRGREKEQQALLNMIQLYDIVLVYAKSGTGKTSLLNAGILQPLREREFFPAMVRLNQSELDPIESIQRQVIDAAGRQGFEIEGECFPGHLWTFFRQVEFWSGNILMIPAIIFDQFEEVFTLVSRDNRLKLISQLGDLVYGRHPELFSSANALVHDETAPKLKIVISLREDYLGEMELVAAEMPRVMHHRFRLSSLDRCQAERAICGPAAQHGSDFSVAPYSYREDALQILLDFLCTRRERDQVVVGDHVEPFQLQILCRNLEDIVLARSRTPQPLSQISPKELGGPDALQDMLVGFYRDQIANLERVQDKKKVRRLCEEGLISVADKRLSMEVGEIKRHFGIGKGLLEDLVDNRLLRKEHRVGSVYYELSHDNLVQAVLGDYHGRVEPRQFLFTTVLFTLVPLIVTRSLLGSSIIRSLLDSNGILTHLSDLGPPMALLVHLSNHGVVGAFHGFVGSLVWGTLIPAALLIPCPFVDGLSRATKTLWHGLAGALGGFIGGIICSILAAMVLTEFSLVAVGWIDETETWKDAVSQAQYFWVFPLTGALTGAGVGCFLFTRMKEVPIKRLRIGIREAFSMLLNKWSIFLALPLFNAAIIPFVLATPIPMKDMIVRSLGEGIVHFVGSLGLAAGFFYAGSNRAVFLNSRKRG